MITEANTFKKNWQKEQRRLLKTDADCAYLYLHLEEDTDEPFYVGMGDTATRPWDMDARSLDHKERVEEHGVRVELTPVQLSWSIAGWWEKRWIKAFRDAGYDLVNIADGGDGLSSRAAKEINSRPEVRAKHRETQSRPDVKARKSAGLKKAWAEKPQDQKEIEQQTRTAAVIAAHSRPEVKANTILGQNRPETIAKKRANTIAQFENYTQEDIDRMTEKRLAHFTAEDLKQIGLKAWATRVKNGTDVFTDEHCGRISIKVQAWRDGQTEEEKSIQSLKIWESRRANGTDKPERNDDGKSIAYLKGVETQKQNGTYRTSQEFWDTMTDEKRKEMGRKMSEGRKRAKEARLAAQLKELEGK
jgi:hypothetical protein